MSVFLILLFSIFISYLHYLDLFWWLFSLIFYYILVFFLYFFIYFILYFKWLFSLIFIYFSFLISFILFGVTPNHLQEYHFLIIFLFIYFLFLFGLLLLSSGLGLTGEIMKWIHLPGLFPSRYRFTVSFCPPVVLVSLMVLASLPLSIPYASER